MLKLISYIINVAHMLRAAHVKEGKKPSETHYNKIQVV